MKILEVAITNKTILIIDDEINVRELVELCLTDLAGWNVVTVDSPLQGLQKVVVDHLDAILLDISTLDMDSFKFLEQLRNNPQTQAIPVLLLSAKARWLDSQILRQYQVAGVIRKPFDPVTLPVQIAKILRWDYTPPID